MGGSLMSMREVSLSLPVKDIERETFRAALATLLEMPLDAVPGLEGDSDFPASWTLSRWLGGLGLGLVPVVDPPSFSWAGPWLARVRPTGGESRFVVMYGVPSGVVWDPGGDGRVANSELSDAYVVAASDISLARPALPKPPETTGRLEEIWIASAAGEPACAVERVRVIPGQGLEGDRHVLGKGTFPSALPGSALTLIEAEVCESFDPRLRGSEHRRNLVTRGIELNKLMGRDFVIGRVRCRGVRLCEPCTVVEGYASRPLLRALVHRGGLRADIFGDGELAIGDEIRSIAGAG